VASLERLGVRAEVQGVAGRCAAALAARLGRALVLDEALPPARDDELPADAPVRSAVDLLGQLPQGAVLV
jgi:hypothetical protein